MPSYRGPVSALLYRLLKDLRDRRDPMRQLENYYAGDHPLPFLSRRAAVRYRRLVEQARTNWPALIVDTVADRMSVEGFRLNTAVDDAAWELWQGSGMDAEQGLVHLDQLVYGLTYVMVWPDETNPTGVRITAESPYQVSHVWRPGAPRRVGAALKAYHDPLSDTWEAWLFTADEVQRYRASSRNDGGMPADEQWAPDGPPEPSPLPGSCLIVPFANRMRTDGKGRSELHGLLTQVDRLNTTVAQRLLAGEYAAFRQRWATGLEVPEDEDGNPVQPFDVAVDRLLVAEDPNTAFGSFDVTDLRPYIDAVSQDVQHLASVSRTPPHYLLGSMVNLSAEALKAAEAGLVAKVKDRLRSTGESWEYVLRLALELAGTNPAPNAEGYGLDQLEVVWADPENISEATRMDALTKMQSLQVPLEALWERMPNTTPTEVARWRSMRGTDTLQTLLRTGRVQNAPIAEGADGNVTEVPATPAEG